MAQNTESIPNGQMLWVRLAYSVLLGLRTMLKDALIHSASEMVYGQPLVVPGKFFPYDSTADQTQIDILRQHLAPCRPSKLNNTTSYIPADFSTCEYVFIREDAHKPPLSKPYRGPFRVLTRTDKSYRVQLDNREDWISIDRLKPAYLDITGSTVISSLLIIDLLCMFFTPTNATIPIFYYRSHQLTTCLTLYPLPPSQYTDCMVNARNDR